MPSVAVPPEPMLSVVEPAARIGNARCGSAGCQVTTWVAEIFSRAIYEPIRVSTLTALPTVSPDTEEPQTELTEIVLLISVLMAMDVAWLDR